MTKALGVSAVLALAAASGACGVGGGGGGGGGADGGGGSTPVTPVDDGQVCQAHFTVTGTFTAGAAARPTDPDTGQPITGCWPAGTWNFTAAVADNNCSSAPSVLPSYSFRVDEVPSSDGGNDTEQQITNLTSVGSMQVHLAVSSNGQGCEGSFEMGSTDGTDYWNMKPTLAKDPATTALGGGGDYIEYKSNSWPWAGQ